MSNEELLRPRYKVIADYPNNIHKIGSIIENKAGEPFDKIKFYQCAKHPHIFKRLEWYEDRKPEDMPEYLKEIEDGHTWIYKSGVDFIYRGGIVDMVMKNDKRRLNYCYVLPATESDYISQTKNQQP